MATSGPRAHTARLPPLKALRAFEAAVRTGSLTAAAAELSVTHSAVSQQIKTLETHFGQALLVRGARGVEPTTPARNFYEETRASLDRIGLAAEQLSQAGAGRILRINATPSLAVNWLIPRLSSFQIANPRVEVRVATSVVSAGKLKDPFDVVMRRGPMSKSGFACARFLPDVLGAVASPEYLRRHPVKQPADCLKHTMLHLSARPNAWPRWLEAAGVRTPRKTDGPSFEHFFLSVQAAGANLGIAIGSLALIGEELASGRLVQLFPAVTVEEAGFHMLYRAPQPRDAALDLFTAWVKERGQEAAYRGWSDAMVGRMTV
ncbi:MAG: LysR family transcriptional regulator [Betaproteobacteria bacterium]|nr:LysR family transcriptional regulator [Betaproteobacteria bacterium]